MNYVPIDVEWIITREMYGAAIANKRRQAEWAQTWGASGGPGGPAPEKERPSSAGSIAGRVAAAVTRLRQLVGGSPTPQPA